MFAYWFLFGLFALGSLLTRQPVGETSSAEAAWKGHAPTDSPSSQSVMLAFGCVIIAVLMGLRYQVGGDWKTYELYFRWAQYASFDRVITRSDPAYQVLNWSVQNLGGPLWLVNLVCGGIFAWGLWRFARIQAEPWLAVLVAIPYLVVVVAMGYSRQAVAIGILMAGLASLRGGASVLKFAVYVGAAALFHRTAIVALPLVIFASERNRLLNLIAGASIFLLLYDALLADEIDTLVRNYIEAEYSSQGAAIRVAMNVLPATLFLLTPSRFGFDQREARIWRSFSLAAMMCLVLLLVLPSSTVVDRIALYLYPMQLAVLSRIPRAYFGESLSRGLVIAYCFMVQFVWLNFATHSQYWLPYRLFPM